MVFHRSAAHRQAVSSAQKPRGLRRFGFRILDHLRLVEHDVIKLGVFEAPGVAAQRAVGGEHQVVSAEVIAVALQPGMIEHPQLRSEACRFLLPVEYERLRNDHQGRTDGLAGGAQLAAGFEQRQYLRGLAHTHVVRQAATEGETLQEVHPTQAFALIITQATHKSRRLCSRFNAVKSS